jgi:predicted proteasome-type protease
MAGTINKLEVSVGYTANLGNYESLRLDVSESRNIAEGEDPQQVYKDLWASATSQLYSQFMEMKSRIDGSSGSVNFMNLG